MIRVCLLLLLSSAIIAASCNRDNPLPSGPYEGYLQAQIIYSPGNMDSTEIAHAAFFTNGDTSQPPINFGTVSLNGMSLDYDSQYGYYEFEGTTAFSRLRLNDSVVWHVQGNGSAPGFNFFDGGSYPSCTYAGPDTIYKSTGATINFQITGVDSGTITLPGAPGFSKGIRPESSNITVSPSDIANFPAGEPAYFIIQLYSAKAQMFGGKQYYFGKSKTMSRYFLVQ